MALLMEERFEGLADLRERAQAEVSKVVVGQDRTVELMLVAALSHGHVLLEGPPGSAKTLLCARRRPHARRVVQAHAVHARHDSGGARRANGHERWRGDVRAGRRLHERDARRRDQPHTAPYAGGAVRADAGAAGDGRREVPQAPDPFLVIATQNPYEHEGVFPLPESQLDRFLFKLHLDYCDADAELSMLNLPHNGIAPDMLGEVRPLLGVVGLDRAREELDSTAMSDARRPLHRRGRPAHARDSGDRAGRELPLAHPPRERDEGVRTAQAAARTSRSPTYARWRRSSSATA